VKHYTLVKHILGEEWLNNRLFRFGASRLANHLLSSIEGKEIKYF
jgi:deoxyribose-phosphate aldolase